MTLNFFLKQRYLETTWNPSLETITKNISKTYKKSSLLKHMESNVFKEIKLPALKTFAISTEKAATISKCGYDVRI